MSQYLNRMYSRNHRKRIKQADSVEPDSPVAKRTRLCRKKERDRENFVTHDAAGLVQLEASSSAALINASPEAAGSRHTLVSAARSEAGTCFKMK